ncbi:MAG: AAA family ATPase [Candidatus Thiodiazotropha sp.]
MLITLAIANYRSLLNITAPLGQLNVITGPNGSGKSNLYRSLRLLADSAQGGVINALAREGGLPSTFWAGPESISKQMKKGEIPIRGTARSKPKRLRLGFADSDFGYAISLGLPPPPDAENPNPTKFLLDPEIKQESIWAGEAYRPASLLVDRHGGVVKIRDGRKWHVVEQHLSPFESIFNHFSDPVSTPEILALRARIQGWRFYDHFRTDETASPRLPQLGTRTPVLSHDGSDLAAALQTIVEIGDQQALNEAVGDAFPGAYIEIDDNSEARFSIKLYQHGLLRPLSGAELSDGAIRYLLWIAALLTPRPPPLMVLNEPETSLHPDLLPALARLIISASERTQVWVVSHAARLIAALEQYQNCHTIRLEKDCGATQIVDQGLLDTPLWRWPDKG